MTPKELETLKRLQYEQLNKAYNYSPEQAGIIGALNNLDYNANQAMDSRKSAMDQRQRDINKRMSKDFSGVDWITSPDPYSAALKGFNFDRYPQNTPGAALQTGVNNIAEYLGGMFTGQNRLNSDRDEYKQDKSYFNANPETRAKTTKQQLEDLMYQSFDAIGGLGTIAGIGAKKANLKALKVAQDMRSAGSSTDDIYKDTKWWLEHPDGKPRFEIDDSNFSYEPRELDGINFDELGKAENVGYARDAVFHNALQRNYPDMGSINVIDKDVGKFDQSTGYHNPMINEITVSAHSPADKRSTMGHELQHYVSNQEKFAKGGNLRTAIEQHRWDLIGNVDFKVNDKFEVTREELSELNKMDYIRQMRNISQPKQLFNTTDYYKYSKEIVRDLGMPPKRNQLSWAQEAGEWIADKSEANLNNQIRSKYGEISPDEVQRLTRNAERRYMRMIDSDKLDNTRKAIRELKELGNLSEGKQHLLYKRLADESQARLVQDRLNMNMSDRIADPFYKNYDTPFNDMILRLH